MSLNTFMDKVPHGKRKVTATVLALAFACACAPQRTSDTTPQGSANRFVAVDQASAQPAGPTRTETDLLGPKQIPAQAYYGVQTARALENFQISGVLINHYPEFVQAWAIVKLAAARANTDVGAITRKHWQPSRRRQQRL